MTWVELENKVREIASLRWGCDAITETIAGVKCDCVLKPSSGECVLVEITKERNLDKVRSDIAKLAVLRAAQMNKYIACKCYIVLELKPMDSMREIGTASSISVVSVEEFQNEFFLEKLHSIFHTFSDTVKWNASVGRTDILIDAENIFKEVLDLVFDYKLDRPTQYKRNFPAIDLVDEKKRVAVQITSKNTRQKVQQVAEKFLQHGFNQEYMQFTVLILVYAPSFRSSEQVVSQFIDRIPGFRIMTLIDLLQEIEKVPTDRLRKIVRVLEENIGKADTEMIPSDISDPEPQKKTAELSNTGLQVLRLASLLPKEGLEKAVFELGLSTEQRKSMVDLIDDKVILEKDDLVRINTYFGNILFNLTNAECEFFLNQLWKYEHAWHWERMNIRRRTQTEYSLARVFANASDILGKPYSSYAQRSAEFWFSLQEYDKAVKRGKEALSYFESCDEKSWNVARTLDFIGECHFNLGKMDLALDSWKHVLTMCENSLLVSQPDLAIAYQKVGHALLKLNEYNAAKFYLLKALRIMEALRKQRRQFFNNAWMDEIYQLLSDVYHSLRETDNELLCTENKLLPLSEQADLWSALIPLQLPFSSLSEENFAGREEELALLARRVGEKKNAPIFVTGLGGMGKTALVAQFCRLYRDGQVYFVRFRDSFTKTVAQGIAVGMEGYAERKPDPEQDYRDVMEILSKASARDILVIDNAEEENGDFGALQKDPAWQDLRNLPLQLVITTRCDVPNAIRVGGMVNENLYQLFTNQKLELDKYQMDALIYAVNGHTMTVELIARTLKRNRMMTAEKLLDALKNGDLPEQTVRPVAIERNGQVEQEYIYTHLKNLFNVAEISEDARSILRDMTVLPENGLSMDILEAVMNDDGLDVLNSQIDSGWLGFDADTRCVTIHPVVRMICRDELKPNDETCGNFLNAVWNKYDPNQYDAEQLIQYAALFSQAAESLPDRDGEWSHRAARFLGKLGKVEDALHYELQVVSRRQISMPASGKMAEAYNDIGITYGELGDHYRALEYQLKALEIREKILPADYPSLANSYNNVGLSYGNLGDNEKALEYMLRSIETGEQTLSENSPDLAQVYSNTGLTYGELGDYPKALEYQMKALKIREKVLARNHPDLATSFDNVGSAYGNLGDHQKALNYKLKALEIFEKVLPLEHPSLTMSYVNVGSTYSDLGDYQKAREYQMKALEIQKKVLPPEHPDLAISYNNVGFVYYRLGDFRKALEYVMKALEIQEKALPPEHPDLASSYNNIGNVYTSLGDHQKAMEYYRKTLEIREKVLPSMHPEIASAYGTIGLAYGDIGDYSNALAYLQKAMDIFTVILPEGHPYIIELREEFKQYRMMRNMLAHGVNPDDSIT